MNNVPGRAVGWVARILGLVFAVFLSLSALNSPSIAEHLVQLIPTFVVIAAVIVAWVRPGLGAILFLALSAGATVYYHGYERVDHLLAITLPLVVVTVLFFLQWLMGKQPSPPAGAAG